MSANDQFFPRPEGPPPEDDLAPLVLPVDRSAEAPLVLPVDESDIPTVLPVPKPPHPGFWCAVLWCIGFLVVTQTPGGLIVGVATQIELTQHREQYRALMSSPLGLYERLMQSELVATSMIIAFAVAQILVVVGSLVTIRIIVGTDWKRRLALHRPSLTHLVLVLIGMPAVLILSSGLDEITKRLIPSLSNFGMMDIDDLAKGFGNWPWFLAVLIIGVGPAVGEELWFRGFLGRGLVGRHGPVVGVLLTSFIFGFIHLIPRQAISAAILGIALHYVYLTTRCLYLPMLMHFINNSAAVFILRFNAQDPSAEQLGIPSSVYVGAGILIAAVAWVLYVSRPRLVSGSASDLPAWQPAYPGVEHPPLASGTIVHRPWPGWLSSGLVAAGLSAFLLTIYLAQSTQPGGSP